MKNTDISVTRKSVHGTRMPPPIVFISPAIKNIGYTISEQDTIYILQTEFIATLFL